MAKLAMMPDTEFEMRPGETANEWYKRTEALLAEYQDVARKVQAGNPGVVKHAIIKFQVADGYAWYRVIESAPLTIQHIPFLDGYAIPDAHIRGLRKQDILDQIEWDKQWRSMTAGGS